MKKEEKDIKSFSKSQQEQLSELFNTVFNSDSSNVSSNEAKDLDTIKIILASVLNNQHLESLTNLSEEQIDDLNDAFYLYEYYDNPIILNFIEHRLKLQRSVIKDKPKNLLEILSEIAGKGNYGIENMNEKNTILGRFRR